MWNWLFIKEKYIQKKKRYSKEISEYELRLIIIILYSVCTHSYLISHWFGSRNLQFIWKPIREKFYFYFYELVITYNIHNTNVQRVLYINPWSDQDSMEQYINFIQIVLTWQLMCILQCDWCLWSQSLGDSTLRYTYILQNLYRI